MARIAYLNHAKGFINEIFPFLAEETKSFYHIDTDAIGAAMDKFSRRSSKRAKISSGVSRVVIIYRDFVIKFDKTNGNEYFGNCESEYNFYRSVKNTRYEKYFCPIKKYFYHGYPFYIMPRAKNSISTEYEYKPDLYYLIEEDDRDWIYENVFDLHHGNYGFFGEKPIIIDYAGNYYK